jgi:hypothetical protein
MTLALECLQLVIPEARAEPFSRPGTHHVAPPCIDARTTRWIEAESPLEIERTAAAAALPLRRRRHLLGDEDTVKVMGYMWEPKAKKQCTGTCPGPLLATTCITSIQFSLHYSFIRSVTICLAVPVIDFPFLVTVSSSQ